MMLYVAVTLAYEYEKHLLSSEQNGLCASKHDHFSTYSSLLNKKHSFSYKILPCWMHFCSVQNNLLYQDLFCWLLMWCRTGSAWLDMKIYTLYIISWSAVINLKVPFWSHTSTSVNWKTKQKTINKQKPNKQNQTCLRSLGATASLLMSEKPIFLFYFQITKSVEKWGLRNQPTS